MRRQSYEYEAPLFGEARDRYNLPPAGCALVSSDLSPAQSQLQLHRDKALKRQLPRGNTLKLQRFHPPWLAQGAP